MSAGPGFERPEEIGAKETAGEGSSPAEMDGDIPEETRRRLQERGYLDSDGEEGGETATGGSDDQEEQTGTSTRSSGPMGGPGPGFESPDQTSVTGGDGDDGGQQDQQTGETTTGGEDVSQAPPTPSERDTGQTGDQTGGDPQEIGQTETSEAQTGTPQQPPPGAIPDRYQTPDETLNGTQEDETVSETQEIAVERGPYVPGGSGSGTRIEQGVEGVGTPESDLARQARELEEEVLEEYGLESRGAVRIQTEERDGQTFLVPEFTSIGRQRLTERSVAQQLGADVAADEIAVRQEDGRVVVTGGTPESQEQIERTLEERAIENVLNRGIPGVDEESDVRAEFDPETDQVNISLTEQGQRDFRVMSRAGTQAAPIGFDRAGAPFGWRARPDVNTGQAGVGIGFQKPEDVEQSEVERIHDVALQDPRTLGMRAPERVELQPGETVGEDTNGGDILSGAVSDFESATGIDVQGGGSVIDDSVSTAQQEVVNRLVSNPLAVGLVGGATAAASEKESLTSAAGSGLDVLGVSGGADIAVDAGRQFIRPYVLTGEAITEEVVAGAEAGADITVDAGQEFIRPYVLTGEAITEEVVSGTEAGIDIVDGPAAAFARPYVLTGEAITEEVVAGADAGANIAVDAGRQFIRPYVLTGEAITEEVVAGAEAGIDIVDDPAAAFIRPYVLTGEAITEEVVSGTEAGIDIVDGPAAAFARPYVLTGEAITEEVVAGANVSFLAAEDAYGEVQSTVAGAFYGDRPTPERDLEGPRGAIEMQLEEEVGVDLEEEDIAFESSDSEGVRRITGSLTEEGRRTVAVESAPFQGYPILEQASETVARTDVTADLFAEDFRGSVRELTGQDWLFRGGPNIDVDALGSGLITAGAVGVATPEPVTSVSGAGAVAVGGLLVGTAALAGALSEGAPRASATATIKRSFPSEIDTPDRPARSPFRPEIATPDRPATSPFASEFDVGPVSPTGPEILVGDQPITERGTGRVTPSELETPTEPAEDPFTEELPTAFTGAAGTTTGQAPTAGPEAPTGPGPDLPSPGETVTGGGGVEFIQDPRSFDPYEIESPEGTIILDPQTAKVIRNVEGSPTEPEVTGETPTGLGPDTGVPPLTSTAPVYEPEVTGDTSVDETTSPGTGSQPVDLPGETPTSGQFPQIGEGVTPTGESLTIGESTTDAPSQTIPGTPAETVSDSPALSSADTVTALPFENPPVEEYPPANPPRFGYPDPPVTTGEFRRPPLKSPNEDEEEEMLLFGETGAVVEDEFVDPLTGDVDEPDDSTNPLVGGLL